ncbi:hypothetical protein G6F42_025898 [Rhizopus arrhizus]|nr:hypothetical protein G6F42_025898 [Rhizopus arrhizus]
MSTLRYVHATFGLTSLQADDAHGQIKSTTTTADEKHAESAKVEKEKESVEADRESDASVVVKPEPFLAQYEATLATVLSDAANYKPTPSKSISAETKEDTAVTARNIEPSSREVKVKSAIAIAASTAVANAASALGTDQDTAFVKSKAPEPVLAAYEATVASTALKAQQFIDSLPTARKEPRPFLAAFEATTASTALEASHSTLCRRYH